MTGAPSAGAVTPASLPASRSRWNRAAPARLRNRCSSAGRPPAHVRQARAPSVPSRSGRAAGSGCRHSVSKSSSSGGSVAGSGAIDLAVAVADAAGHRRHFGIAPDDGLRRLDAGALEERAEPRPLRVGRGARFRPFIHRQGGDEGAHAAFSCELAGDWQAVISSAAPPAPAPCRGRRHCGRARAAGRRGRSRARAAAPDGPPAPWP